MLMPNLRMSNLSAPLCTGSLKSTRFKKKHIIFVIFTAKHYKIISDCYSLEISLMCFPVIQARIEELEEELEAERAIRAKVFHSTYPTSSVCFHAVCFLV